MFHLNPEVLATVSTYQDTLATTGRVCIPDIFVPADLKTIENEFKAIPASWWTEVMNVRGTSKYAHNGAINGEVNEESRIAALKETRDAMKIGFFCYHFKEARHHYDTCVCIVCSLRNSIKTESFEKLFYKLTGEEVKVAECFASKYETGHFLTIHHDKDKGKYAFVFSFNRDWNPTHGGILHFVQDNKITQSYVPSFNNLVIFKLPEGQEIDHFVSEVVGSQDRYSLAGWLK